MLEVVSLAMELASLLAIPFKIFKLDSFHRLVHEQTRLNQLNN